MPNRDASDSGRGVRVDLGAETYHEDGQRKNRAQGNQRAGNTFDKKAEGQDMARDRGTEHVVNRWTAPSVRRSGAALIRLIASEPRWKQRAGRRRRDRCSQHCSRPPEGDASVGGLAAPRRLPPVLIRFGGR